MAETGHSMLYGLAPNDRRTPGRPHRKSLPPLVGYNNSGAQEHDERLVQFHNLC